MTGPVNILVYIFTVLSGFSGLVFAFFNNSPEVQNSPIFHQGIILGNNLWGILVLLGSILMMVGLLTRRRWPAQIGSMLSFMMWIFAAISAFQIGYYLSIVSLSAYLMIFAYVYLASSLGLLEEVDRKDPAVLDSHHND